MKNPRHIPARSEVGDNTPLRLAVAAILAYPDGSFSPLGSAVLVKSRFSRYRKSLFWSGTKVTTWLSDKLNGIGDNNEPSLWFSG